MNYGESGIRIGKVEAMKRIVGCYFGAWGIMLIGSLFAFGGPPRGVVPDVAYHLALLSEPSSLSCDDGKADCTTKPPKSAKVLLSGEPFFVEVWVTKASPDLDPDPPHDPGISCAYVDLVSHEPVGEIGMEYGDGFDAGPPFDDGTFDGDGGVMDLGTCTFAPGGVGLWPEWVLVARVELQQDRKSRVWFELAEPTTEALGTAIYGKGFAASVDYGKERRAVFRPLRRNRAMERGTSRACESTILNPKSALDP